MGATGGGKSTLINALAANIFLLETDEGDEMYVEIEEKGFEVGNGSCSVTSRPNFMQLEGTDFLLVDFPGLNDSDPYFDLPNMCTLRTLIANAAKVVLCFVVRGSSLAADRSAPFLRQITAASRMLSEQGVRSASHVILTLVNEPSRFGPSLKMSAVVDFLKIKKQAVASGEDSDILHELDGAEYP